jgi:hypothetical protein
MAVLDKKDLCGVLGLLAIVFLFDGIGSGLIVTGVIGFVIMAVLIWFSGQPAAKGILGSWPAGKNAELIFRVAVVVVLIGVLLFSYLIVGLGILIGIVMLYLPAQTFHVDLWNLSVKAEGSASKAEKKPKR